MSDDLQEFPDGWQRATVIVAHPDDIEWGSAAAVAAWTAAGRTVSYVLVTSGEAGIDGLDPATAKVAREAEERASGAVVGVTEIEFLGHPDGRVVDGLDLRRDLAAAIRRHRPDIVVGQNHAERWGTGPGAGWNSADHRAVGRATIDAVSDAGNRWIFPELREEPWAGVQWIVVPNSPAETHAVDVSGVVDKAIGSLSAHEQYIKGIGVADPVAFATELVERQTSGVAERFGGRPGVAFELIPGPAAVMREPATASERAVSERRRVSSGSPFEGSVGYCRAVAVGDRIFVSGTAPQWPDGTVAESAGVQARRCFEIIGAALTELGSGLDDIVRVRVFLIDAADFGEVAAVHGELFATVRPTNTTVVVAALLDPRWKVEIEVEAVSSAASSPG